MVIKLIDLLTTAGVQQFSVALASLDPVTLQPGAMQSPRPGANLSVAITSSSPNVLAATTSTLQFPVQLQTVTGVSAGFEPMAAGTAVVTLGNLAGNPTPASRNQLVFNVSQP